jgi:2-hydroxy-4-(methylsulfanyl)butanoate S-methyltransferase
MTSDQISPATIARLGTALYPSLAMLAGMKLDLFTPLKDGPLPCPSIAQAIGVNPDKLRPLLYALVNAGLLSVEAERFANTPEADRYLVRGRATYLGGTHELYTDMWTAALKAADSIRADVPQARHDWESMPDEELAGIFRGLHGGALATGRQLAKSEGLDQCRSLLDVGGGSGGLAIGACEACPGLRATVVELPKIAAIATDFVARSGLADRVRVMAADVSERPPEGAYDVIMVRNLLQVLSRDQARRVLTNVGASMPTGGMLYIVGHVLDDSRLAPAAAVGINLVFLGIYDAGQSYTEGEHRIWLTDAGFGDIDVRFGAGPVGSTIIAARKRAR